MKIFNLHISSRKHTLPVVIIVGIGCLVLLLNGRKYTMKQEEKGVSKDAIQPVWLDGMRTKGLAHNLVDADLDKMDKNQIFYTLHSYFDNIDIICKRKFRMGNLGDGGWEVCDDPDVRPMAPCIVYSYGINNDWSFDDAISKHYGCHVFSFDPTMVKDTHNRSEHVHFYKIGVKGWITYNNSWEFYSHQELRNMLGHKTSVVDVIKMDVENSEWGALDDMIKSDQLKDVKQLFVEFHFNKTKPLLEYLKVIQSLEAAGFRIFYSQKNKTCPAKDYRLPIQATACYEVHFIKK